MPVQHVDDLPLRRVVAGVHVEAKLQREGIGEDVVQLRSFPPVRDVGISDTLSFHLILVHAPFNRIDITKGIDEESLHGGMEDECVHGIPDRPPLAVVHHHGPGGDAPRYRQGFDASHRPRRNVERSDAVLHQVIVVPRSVVHPGPRVPRRLRSAVVQILQHGRLVGLVDLVGPDGIDLEGVGIERVEIERIAEGGDDQGPFGGRQPIPRGRFARVAGKVGGAAGLQLAFCSSGGGSSGTGSLTGGGGPSSDRSLPPSAETLCSSGGSSGTGSGRTARPSSAEL